MSMFSSSYLSDFTSVGFSTLSINTLVAGHLRAYSLRRS